VRGRARLRRSKLGFLPELAQELVQAGQVGGAESHLALAEHLRVADEAGPDQLLEIGQRRRPLIGEP